MSDDGKLQAESDSGEFWVLLEVLHQLAKKLLVTMMLYLKPQYPSSTGISFIELI
jgi:hypothetical protein